MKITKRQLRRIIAEGQDQFSHVVKSSTRIFGRPMEIDEEMDGNLVIVADEAEVEKHYSELMSVFPHGEMIEDGFATGVYEDMSRAPFRESKMKITKKQLIKIIKEEKAKLLDEAKPSEMSMHDAAEHYSQQRASAGLKAFGDGMRMLKTVISNLEEAGDMENAELVKIAMGDLERAMRTMREV